MVLKAKHNGYTAFRLHYLGREFSAINTIPFAGIVSDDKDPVTAAPEPEEERAKHQLPKGQLISHNIRLIPRNDQLRPTV